MVDKCSQVKNPTKVNALPEEMLLFIFKKLSLHDAVLNWSKTCVKWRDTVALGILKPAILELARTNVQFKEEIKLHRLTKNCKDSDLMLSLYGKYEKYSSKYFLITSLEFSRKYFE